MGVVINNNDYFLIIISLLLVFLLSFALAQLAAVQIFAAMKMIKPDVLTFLLMEKAKRQKVQQVCCASKNGKNKD